MIKDLLDTVAGWQKRYKQIPQPPADAAAVADLRARSQAELGADIPDEYAELLRLANGVDWNGFFIYATERTPIAGREGKKPRFIEGFVEQNKRWRELPPKKDLLVVAESGDAIYTYNLAEKAFQDRDRQSNDVIQSYPSLEAMLEQALDRYKPPNP